MLARLSAALLLSLTACAAHEGPTPTPTPTRRRPSPPRRDQVAIASVQLAQDCPDPASDAAATPSTAGQAYAPAATGPGRPGPSGRRTARPGPADARPRSRARRERRRRLESALRAVNMQLSLANTGDRPGKIDIKAVRLLDARDQT